MRDREAGSADARVEAALSGSDPALTATRLVLLDALRGFALLGIFLMNIEWFNRPFQLMGTGIDPSTRGADRTLAWMIYALVQGKFWVLFSLLFGASFALMYERASACSDGSFAGAYWRRLTALAAFGIAHALLLWPGDILFSYALAGIGLWWMRYWPVVLQRNLGIGIYAALTGLSLLSAWFIWQSPEAAAAFASFLTEQRGDAIAAAAAYAQGDWQAVTRQRWMDFWMIAGNLWWQIVSALAVFPIGVWLLRSGRLRDPTAHRLWSIRIGAVCALVGGAFAVAAITVQVRPVAGEGVTVLLAEAFLLASGLPLAIAWLCAAMLAWQLPYLHAVLCWLAPAGRMALTNYLLQSAIASTVFYGYGLGWWGQLSRSGQCGFVLMVFIAQVVASRWWLSRWRYGPIEYLWRWMTWARRPSMRLHNA